MDWLLTLGLIAAALTSLAGFPQLIKSIKTKSTKDISLGMFVALVVGIVFWLVYGFAVKDVPIIAANLVALVINLSILVLKLKYK